MARPADKKGGVAQAVAQIVAPIAEACGVKIWDIRYEKEGSSWYLRIFIDKPGGVNIDDCERLSRAVDKPLDEADPVPGSYFLEVSSPGIERDLVRPEHFAAFLGHDVSVRLIRPQDGVREFVGKLLSCEGDTVTVQPAGRDAVAFSKKQAAFVRLYEDYESGGE